MRIRWPTSTAAMCLSDVGASVYVDIQISIRRWVDGSLTISLFARDHQRQISCTDMSTNWALSFCLSSSRSREYLCTSLFHCDRKP